MQTKIKILVAESSEFLRKSISTILKTNPDFKVVAEVSNNKELFENLKFSTVDIVLFSPCNAALEGKVALDIIKNRFPDAKVVFLNIHSDATTAADYLAKGARCILNSDCSPEFLFDCIKTVHKEGYFFDKLISMEMLSALIRDKSISTEHADIVFNKRETEILKAICDGKTNKEIATELYLSVSAIDFHRTKIYSKVQCNNVAGLLRFALKRGIVTLT